MGFVWAWMFALLAAAPTLAHSNAPAERWPLDQGWAVLLDPGETLGPQDLGRAEVQSRFKALDGPPALGYLRGAAWLRLTLRPPPGVTGERLLELQFPPIDEVTLFWPGGNGQLQLGRTAGDRHPLAQREVLHRNVVYRVQLEPGTEPTFYLRVRGSNTFHFSVVLWQPEAFVSAAMTEQLLWGVVLAVHIVLILSNLWFFQALRDAPHGLFALFALTSFLSVLFLEGFGHRYLLDGWPRVNDALVVGSWMLAQPMAYLFVLRFVGLTGPGGRTWARLLVWGQFLFSVAMILGDQVAGLTWARALFSAVQLTGVPVLAGILAVHGRRGNEQARQTLVAMLPVMAAVFMRLARNLGLLEANSLFDHGYYVGLLLYLLMLNFAISRRQEALRRAAESARDEALITVSQSARELEVRVQERTAQTTAAMRQVEASLALERRLRADQRTFFATVSHELRTPLAVIDTTVQNLALQQPPPPPAMQARLRKVLAATERMAALLQRHLGKEQLDDDAPRVNVQPCDLAALLADAADAARLLSDRHTLSVQVSPSPGLFACDPELTRLALGNLAQNAVLYSPLGSAVVLRARARAAQEGGGVVLEVADNGPGVPTHEQERLFSGSYRGAAAQAAGVPGTGMGLLLARRMVEAQGGTLSLEFPQGGGTLARIVLPEVPPSRPVSA